MQLVSGFLSTIILLGALQGFILSSLLFFSAKGRRRSPVSPATTVPDNTRLPNRLLGVLIFLMSLASLKLYGAEKGWFDKWQALRLLDTFVPLIVAMPFGPLIFFYVKSSLDPGFRLTKRHRRHFYPVIIDCGPQIIAIIFVVGVITHTIRNTPAFWGNLIDNYNVYSDIPRWISVSVYVWMSARLLAAARRDSATPRTTAAPLRDPSRIRWLRQVIRILFVFQCIWLLYLIPYVIPRYTDVVLNTVDWYPIYVPLAILIYWMGIKGYIISFRESPAKKETTSPLPADTLQQAMTSLRAAMETDRLYLNPTLTVALLATHTGLPAKTISAVLNQYMHKSFNEFVNEYRVQAIKERLLRGEAGDHTIAGLAYDCGFNSLPTFQRAFKTILGQTPKEFLSQNQPTSAQIRI